ncbi:MAG: TetR/AcrR family transcriptional regulator [bacterium]
MARKKIAHTRREEIIAGLYDCLAVTGHEQVTLRDIAKRANVSYGVIHYFFTCKKDIITALAKDYVNHRLTLVKSQAAQHDSSPERLHKLVSFLTELIIFEKKSQRVFLNLYHMALNDRDIWNAYKSSFKRFRGLIQKIVEEGISRGEFDHAASPASFALMFVSLIEGMALQTILAPTLFDKQAVKDLLYKYVMIALSPKPTSPSQ